MQHNVSENRGTAWRAEGGGPKVRRIRRVHNGLRSPFCILVV